MLLRVDECSSYSHIVRDFFFGLIFFAVWLLIFFVLFIFFVKLFNLIIEFPSEIKILPVGPQIGWILSKKVSVINFFRNSKSFKAMFFFFETRIISSNFFLFTCGRWFVDSSPTVCWLCLLFAPGFGDFCRFFDCVCEVQLRLGVTKMISLGC